MLHRSIKSTLWWTVAAAVAAVLAVSGAAGAFGKRPTAPIRPALQRVKRQAVAKPGRSLQIAKNPAGQPAGRSGKTLPAPAGKALAVPPSEIHMLDARNGYGWSVEHPVVVTRDGGATWFDATPRNAGDTSTAVIKGYFTDAWTGWVFSLRAGTDMTVYGTGDGGNSWARLAAVPVKYGDGNMSVAFADARHGWFEEKTAGMGQSAGELFATGDGGKTWQKVAESTFGNPAAPDPRGVLPFGGQLQAEQDGTLWLNGGQRAAEYQGGPGFIWLFKSTDGGRTWAQVKLPVPAANRQDGTYVSQPVFFGQRGLVTVLYTSGNAVVYASADGGTKWAARGTLPMGGWPVFADATHGWQSDGRRVYRTQDGGRSWQPLAADPTLRKADSERFLSQLSFIDAKHGWAVFEGRGANIGPMLLATTDGGRTWHDVNR